MALFALDGISPDLPAPGKHWIAPDATLIGKVTLEEMASVWFGSVVRGDNERITIGKRSNVQDNCVLHTDMGFPLVIGADVTIGHNVMLHGCTVEDRALVGMGATVLNGAKIGARQEPDRARPDARRTPRTQCDGWNERCGGVTSRADEASTPIRTTTW